MKFDFSNVVLSYVDKKIGTALPKESSPELAELIGILAGDGCVSCSKPGKNNRVEVVFNIKDELPHMEYVKALFKIIFNLAYSVQLRPSKGIAVLTKRSLGVFTFLRAIGYGKIKCIITVPDWIWENKNEAAAFVRGVFDTDGSLSLKRNHGKYEFYPVVGITLKDEKVIRKLGKWASENNIPNYVGDASYFDKRTNKRYAKFNLQISGYKNVGKWMTLVGSNNQKHLNKWRKTNRWEERDLNPRPHGLQPCALPV